MRVWIPFLVVFVSGVWLCERLLAEVHAAGYGRVDTRRASLLPAGALQTPGAFVDERWEPLVRDAIARIPPFDVMGGDADEARAALQRSIAALPFVASVAEPRVRWPDGIDLDIRLRDVVACVRSGEAYFGVSSDGVLLPGGWSAPPWIGQGFLPVIGPNDGAFDRAVAGARLVEPRHRDALAVAVSMRGALSAETFEMLGPPVIDATRARQASVEEPGIVIRCSGRRAVLFGRSPDCGEPGELPVASKWTALERGARVLRDAQNRAEPDARDWSVLDVRWDTPEIRWRELADPEQPGAASGHRGG